MKEIYKQMDRFEVMLLRSMPIPLTPFCIVLQSALLNHCDKLKEVLPENFEQDIVQKSYKIPHLPLIIVNIHKIISVLDKVRADLANPEINSKFQNIIRDKNYVKENDNKFSDLLTILIPLLILGYVFWVNR